VSRNFSGKYDKKTTKRKNIKVKYGWACFEKSGDPLRARNGKQLIEPPLTAAGCYKLH